MEVDLSRLFKWNSRTYSLQSFVDDNRNTLPRIIQVVEGFCPESEVETLENGQILVLQGVQREQFVVVTQSNGTEICIPCKCAVKVELVSLDRLNEEYSTVEELFEAQPDYFRVLDDMPSLDIKSGTVLKICSRQNGVYDLECEAVDHAAPCEEIIKLPLTQHGRFLPLHDAREYVLEEVLARFPPPSQIGVRLINSSSTGSLSFTPDTQLPWGSDLRVQRTFHDDTIIATAAGEEVKEVLLIPKTLDVSVVPALDCSVKSEQLTTMGRTSTFDCLEQAMKFLNSLRAYHGRCRLRRFSIEDLTTLPLSESCDVLSMLHEPPIPQTTVTKGKQGDKKNSVDPCSGKPLYPVVQNMSRNMTPPEEDDMYDDVLPNDPHAAPSQLSLQKTKEDTLGRQEHSRKPAKVEKQVDCTGETSSVLALPLGPRSLSEDDVSRNITSEKDDDRYIEVLSDGPKSAPPQPSLEKRKDDNLRRQEHSKTPAKVENQVDCTSARLSTLALPLGPRSLSEIDLSRNITAEEDDNNYEEVLFGGTRALPPQLQKITRDTPDTLPLPLVWKSLSESDLHGMMAPDEGNVDYDKTHSLPPRQKQIGKPIFSPVTHPRVRRSDKPVPLPPPPCKRVSEGSSLEKEITARESSNSDEDENGYCAISLDIRRESEYEEMEDKVYKDDGTLRELAADKLEEAHSETERQWSCGKAGPTGVPGRPGSYWYAYQHVRTRQFYRGLLDSATYVGRPVLLPRRRQQSDITDKIKSKLTESKEEGAGSTQGNSAFFHKKSSSEGDVFRNVFTTTEVGNLGDYYTELLADIGPDETYLEPVDAFPGAGELQVESPDTNCKRVTIGVEGQESQERRISGDSSEEEDYYDCRERSSTYSYPYIDMYPLLRDVCLKSISTSMSDVASTHADDQEENTEEFKPLSSWPVHNDDQNHPVETEKEEEEGKNLDDPIYLSSTAGQKVQIDVHGLSSSTAMAEKKPKNNGKKARVNAKDKKVPRLQKMWAQHQRIRRKPDQLSGNQQEFNCSGSEKNLSPTANVDPQVNSPKIWKKSQEPEAKITKNQESEERKKKSAVAQAEPGFDSGLQKKDGEQEYLDDIQRFVKVKDKKTLISAKFEAELSRVMNIRNQHAHARQTLATSKDAYAHISSGAKSPPPFPSTETSPSFDEQSEKQTRDERSSPKSKKAPVPSPKRKGKSPT